jgi:hypothetical protein
MSSSFPCKGPKILQHKKANTHHLYVQHHEAPISICLLSDRSMLSTKSARVHGFSAQFKDLGSFVRRDDS